MNNHFFVKSLDKCLQVMEFKLYDMQMVNNTLCYDNVNNYDLCKLNVLLLKMQMK
jgi:hypothetical protein